ncbi:MAG: hypothetical protein JW939_10095 [Candidatus Thermoplasmatota archaeon]|nr:hypothetical protein [Candidatus Thermoplasmatota archaeon]
MLSNDETAKQRFRESAVNGRIACSKCFEIADELGLRKDGIASTLTAMDIKIVQCQLGCFR